MWIEHRYYEEFRMLMEQIDKEIKEELGDCSEDQKRMEYDQALEDLNTILQHSRSDRKIKRSIDECKYGAFKSLAQKAVLFAEECHLNIFVETDDELCKGRISLEGEYIMFDDEIAPEGLRGTFFELMQRADRFALEQKRGLFGIDLFYNLYENVDILNREQK